MISIAAQELRAQGTAHASPVVDNERGVQSAEDTVGAEVSR